MHRIGWILGGGLAAVLLGLGLNWSARATPGPQRGAAPLSGTVNAVQEGFESGSIVVGAFDGPTPTCVPAGCGWTVVTTAHHSGSYAAFAPDGSGAEDQQLVLNAALAIPSDAASPTLSFWHEYDLDVNGGQTPDGGVFEVSTNAGATWTDAGGQITGGGYTGTINGGSGNPLLGRAGWVGTTGGVFTQVQVDLAPYRSQRLLFRLR